MNVWRRLLPKLLALALGVLSAYAVACGDSDENRKLIPASSADDIREELDKIAERVERGDCEALEPAFIRLRREVEGLSSAVDRRLRQRLADGVQNLDEIAPEECEDNAPETTPTETVPETIPETEPPPETVPPETTPPETVPPETTPPETTPPETTPPDVIPEDPGGEEAP